MFNRQFLIPMFVWAVLMAVVYELTQWLADYVPAEYLIYTALFLMAIFVIILRKADESKTDLWKLYLLCIILSLMSFGVSALNCYALSEELLAASYLANIIGLLAYAFSGFMYYTTLQESDAKISD